MAALLIEERDREAILKVVAAVLYIGNITFGEDGNGATVENENSEYEVVCESIVLTEMFLTYFLIFVVVLVAPSQLLDIQPAMLKDTLIR